MLSQLNSDPYSSPFISGSTVQSEAALEIKQQPFREKMDPYDGKTSGDHV
jgi:hypothetical protein